MSGSSLPPALLLGLLLSLLSAGALPAAERVPVLLDTDVGGDIDDALALALALQHERIDLAGITTVAGDAHTRALIACRLLHAVGKDSIPVASGAPPRPVPDHAGQMQYGLRPCFRKRPIKERAVDFLYSRLKERPGELTLVAVGPLTNVAELLTRHPECKPWIKRLVVMGGALRVGYSGKPPAEAEWNIRSDVPAARKVFASGVPLLLVPLDVTATQELDKPAQDRQFAARTPLTHHLHALYQLWEKPTPVLFDPVAVALCADESWCKIEKVRIAVDDKGMTRLIDGEPNARVATGWRRKGFVSWFVDQVAPGPPGKAIPLKATNPSRPVARGKMPARVHVIEDYETDIERRWWLAGLPETREVPAGSTRACRGVLTNDFDARMGDDRAQYTAVIFNPVPGPPMGPNTRLSFRYRIKGSDRLRVQIYSLTNGYHRHLTLTDLPQGKWREATVDLTRARRPDGSGGTLSADERIDDIQFYTDADADLLIDDIVLYEAADPKEERPFPRPIFTAWFDTGRLGREWPGDFTIVPHAPPGKWKRARSVPRAKGGAWVRLSLRGPRPLGKTTHLRFRYRLTGTNTLRVALVNRTAGGEHEVVLKDLEKGKWSEATVDFSKVTTRGDRVDEIHWLLPTGAQLDLDDVLLYEKRS
jgi:purine nucleosidase